MTKFSNLLSEIIKNNEELKIYHIAKTIHCDRTWLQKVMTGERKMNYETILPLCSFLKNYISDSLVLELYESFAEEYFGSRRYQTILFIKNRLQEMEKKEGYIHHLTEKKNFDIEYFVNKAERNMEALLREIFRLIMEEKEIAAKQKRDGKFYVHIHVRWTALKDLFLFTLNNEGNGGNIDFRCIFDENGYEENGYKKEDYRMEAFLSACEYVIYQMNVYYVGSRKASFFQAALLPYYVITGSSVLLISENGKMFFRINEEKEVEKFEKYFLDMMEGERFFWQEREYGYETVAELVSTERTYVFSGDFWKGIFGEREVLEMAGEGCLLQKEAAAASEEDFYEAGKKAEVYVIVSPEGMEEQFEEKEELEGEEEVEGKEGVEGKEAFINESGISIEKSSAKRIEKDMKVRAIEQWYEEFRKDKNKKIYFLNMEKYKFHSRFHILLATDRIIQFLDIKNVYSIGGGGKKQGMYLISPEIVKCMKDFFLYLVGCGACMDGETSLKVIQMYMKGSKKR